MNTSSTWLNCCHEELKQISTIVSKLHESLDTVWIQISFPFFHDYLSKIFKRQMRYTLVHYLRFHAALLRALGSLQRMDAKTRSHEIWIAVRKEFNITSKIINAMLSSCEQLCRTVYTNLFSLHSA